MPVSLEAFSRTVGAIHAAAASPERWPETLATIVQLLQASKGALIEIDPDARVLFGINSIGHDPAMQSRYVEHYYAIDPTMDMAFNFEPLTPWVCYEQFPATARTRHEYFDFARSIDIGDVIAITADHAAPGGSRRRAVLSLQRPYRAPRYGTDMKDLIALLGPHLSAAMQVQHRLTEALSAQQTLAAGLDRLSAAAFILDSVGAIRHLNAAARALLANNAGVRVRHGKLGFRDPEMAAAVGRALHRATTREPRSSLLPWHTGGPMVTEVMLAPLVPDNTRAAAWQEPLALLVCNEPPTNAASIAQRMRELHGLTTAEARVMAALALGETVAEIAHNQGVRESTVRSQLRSLFDKTGVSRQSELVRLALAGAAFTLGDKP